MARAPLPSHARRATTTTSTSRLVLLAGTGRPGYLDGHPPDGDVTLRAIPRPSALGLALLAHATGGQLVAQELRSTEQPPSAAHAEISRITVSYFDTPGGAGLLPIARAEAEIAMEHAALAVQDSLYLEGMRRHIEHALHALDPRLAPGGGPGLGYGVRRATEGILQHIELAGSAEDASDVLRTHAEHIAGAARSALDRIDRVASLAGRLRTYASATEALPRVRELEAAIRAVWLGNDTDGDRRVAWAPPEGGARQVQQHMTLLRRAEGLSTEERMPR